MGRETGHERRRQVVKAAAAESGLWVPKGLVAVLDTNVLVSAFLSKANPTSSSRRIVMAVGSLYDSFTSPAIIEETEGVLAEPQFHVGAQALQLWLDTFIRCSRQVNCLAVPGDYSAALGGDETDNPILLTALAVNLHDEGLTAVAEASLRHGCFIVSGDKHFEPGRNVWGWEFIRPTAFWSLLQSIQA